jgi:hypothetical protein
VYKNQFIIHRSKYAPTVSATSAGVITYDYSSTHTRGTNAQKVNFILGQGALLYGTAQGPTFDLKWIGHDDYPEIQELIVYGINRNVLTRNDGVTESSRQGVNTSSMAFTTYSPFNAAANVATVQG